MYKYVLRVHRPRMCAPLHTQPENMQPLYRAHLRGRRSFHLVLLTRLAATGCWTLPPRLHPLQRPLPRGRCSLVVVIGLTFCSRSAPVIMSTSFSDCRRLLPNIQHYIYYEQTVLNHSLSLHDTPVVSATDKRNSIHQTSFVNLWRKPIMK